MTKIINTLMIAFGITLMSCQSSASVDNKNEADTIEITHESGVTNVVENPQKVVVFDLGTLESMDALGIKPIGVPQSHLPNHLLSYAKDASITDVGTVKEPNFEKINALAPDLIIISARLQKYYAELSEIAPTIFLGVDTKDYVGSFEKNMRTLGTVFNKKEEAEAKIKEVESKIAAAKSKIGESDSKALIVLYNNGKFSAYGKSSRFGFIHDVLGVNVADESIEVSTHGQAVSSEFIQHLNPDVLFIVDRNSVVNGTTVNKKEIENALIQQTKAYKNGQIIYLDPQVWYLSGGGVTSTEMMTAEVMSHFNK